MRFWDASALVPLVILEEATSIVGECFLEDERIVTWAWSRVEIVSAIERRVREGSVSRTERRNVLERFHALANSWDEIKDVVAVRSKAIALLARHPIRAADAGQLGAALLFNETMSGVLSFVCLERRLSITAELEALRVIPAPD